jgi:hypothetical protein
MHKCMYFCYAFTLHSNATHRLLQTYNRNQDTYTNSGIYSLRCSMCNMHYMGQTGRNLRQRYAEHRRYIKTNNPKSAYALHILNNRHEYGPIHSTMTLFKTCKKRLENECHGKLLHAETSV